MTALRVLHPTPADAASCRICAAVDRHYENKRRPATRPAAHDLAVSGDTPSRDVGPLAGSPDEAPRLGPTPSRSVPSLGAG